MLRHLLKLVWHKKGANALLVLEIFFTFLVTVLVTTFAAYFAANLRRPLGYSIDRVWRVEIDVGRSSDDEWTAEQAERFARLLADVERIDWVEGAAGVLSPPYAFGSSVYAFDWQGGTLSVEINEVTDGLAEVLGLRLVEGRWFEAADDQAGFEPMVVDAELARALYGDASPLGKPLADRHEGRTRIVGVVDDFRRSGELGGPGPYAFTRVVPGDPDQRPPRNLVVKVAPGSGGEREEELARRLQATAPDWSFEVRPLTELRAGYFRLLLAPLAAGALVAGFLLLMVALGLAGVVWQNVARRRREIGLRRAAGATGGQIYRQLLGELLLTAGLGLALGLALVLQLPAVGLLGSLPGAVFGGAVATALAAILALTAAAGFYPSWLASRIPPAEALHYE